MRRRSSLFVTTLLLLTSIFSACDRSTTVEQSSSVSPDLKSPRFVGSGECSICHADQFRRWTGSDHDLAMQHASVDTVLGNFDNARFTYGDIESSFFIRDGKFWVRTDNEAGELAEYEIKYAFGVMPLQQYLVEFDGGRLQALPIAWDARDSADGGQRWFHIYPDEVITFDDPLHWTGRELNWNYMCAECHSTELKKNFDLKSKTFATTWSEINIGCEGCHGPASTHVAMANKGALTGTMGLGVDLDDTGRSVWQMNLQTGIAERSELLMHPTRQPESCGRCHSRRSLITTNYEFGESLLDTHTPALLDEVLYYPDGQILEEVYVWGSFLQSKMYQAGVTCTDCHDPHTAELKAGGEVSNSCSTCHLPARFATADHQKHEPGQVACVDCHMPSRDYMVIDGRRDHSFRIPRPDLTISTGSPNACGDCHADKSPEWADEAINKWFGPSRPRHYATAIHAGRNVSPGANTMLASAANNVSFPGIARATALSLMVPPIDSASATAIRAGLGNADSLIRLGGLRALAALPPEQRVSLATPLLEDSERAVRIEAVSTVSPYRDNLPATAQSAFTAAEREYVQAQMAFAERPEAHMNLASLLIARGDMPRAEIALKTALEIEPRAIAAQVNLADLYRQLGRDDDARQVLEAGLARDAQSAALHHSLGLLLVRGSEPDSALKELELAWAFEPGNSRYVYVYAVALNTFGRSADAINLLQTARQSFPGDFDIGWALITTLRDAGRTDDARGSAEEMLSQFPENRNISEVLSSL